MATVPYARKEDAPDTYLITFKAVKHSSRDGLGSGSVVDNDTGKSPVSRWLAFAFDYNDLVSRPGPSGYEVKCQLPRGTLALRCAVRVDTAWTGVGASQVDVGDSNDADGWAQDLNFNTVGLKNGGTLAVYNWGHGTSTGPWGQLYMAGAIVTVIFPWAIAQTTGEAILFLEVISYHEEYSREW